MKKIYLFLLLLSAMVLVGCQQKSSNDVIRVGVIAGPEAELMSVAKEDALNNYQQKLKIVEFTDYTMPNQALNDGSIDANVFQHLPFLEADTKARHYELTPIGKTFIYPMGIYSSKYKKISDVPDGSIVAIPNDPSNEGRALLLLQKSGLIGLKSNAGFDANPTDIISNPKHLKIKELDAAQLTRVLPDVAIAVINTNYAVIAGLYPSKDALFEEGSDSPYANIIVVKTQAKDDPRFKNLVDALHSQKVIDKAQELFKGQAIKAW